MEYVAVSDAAIRLKYSTLVVTLSERIAKEQEVRRQRALEQLESIACVESQTRRNEADFCAEAEVAAGIKFARLIAELRHMWEDEEVHRSVVLERRIRSHYDLILTQVQSQLVLALKMNEDADQEWMEEMRNHNYDHVCSMKTFEEKCRSHYELRLNTYTESTDCRLAAYEENLLILGADAAHSCSSLKSKVQRLKVACGKWRIDYQREVQRRYRKVTVELEGLYMREIGNLLADLASASAQLATYHSSMVPLSLAGEASLILKFKSELLELWNKLDTKSNDRIKTLSMLLNSVDNSQSLVDAYRCAINAMRSQLPLAQLVARREFLDYRIALLSNILPEAKDGPSSRPQSASPLEKERTILNHRLIQKLNDYERANKVPFLYRGVR